MADGVSPGALMTVCCDLTKLHEKTLRGTPEQVLQALKDAGVKKVIRIEQDDERTCALCRKLNGKVYEIGKITPLEHLRCRRSFQPYERK